MQNAKIAAIVGDGSISGAAGRLRAILDFLGIPCQLFSTTRDLVESVRSGSLRDERYSVIASLSAISEILADLSGAHSIFLYLSDQPQRCKEALQDLIGEVDLELAAAQVDQVQLKVTTDWPDFTGPMHGIRTLAAFRQSDRLLNLKPADSRRTIIDANGGALFFSLNKNAVQFFVNCGSEFADLTKPVKRNWYDIKDDFVSAVPLMLYLKWAFRGTVWQAGEAGACLIIDDPILREQYGFCNFPQIDRQMQKHSFSTNIAVIPWNWRRTSRDMAALIRDSHGRLSVSVHGCDHTGAEFGSTAQSTLNSKAAVAKLRMQGHQKRTGIAHDLIMVFPQGVFSRESLDVLQQHQYMAAVNTEVAPVNFDGDLTLRDMWSVAVGKYGGVPFFVRRYPSHGLENFAFDLLLGKSCLIVEHHKFFKGDGEQAIRFVNSLNSLNCTLKWRPLGEVIKRSYLWRAGQNGIIDVRMFGNELLLENQAAQEQDYLIEKPDHGRVGIDGVVANGDAVEWRQHRSHISFRCTAKAKSVMFVHVRYRTGPQSIPAPVSINNSVKVAARRYLSEFRDNFLSRHEVVLQLVQRTKGLISRR